ncbi:Gfo/Idh/MocA family protein [Devosia epidermidihirudinis]|uniref:Gfo/Idh/MocA family protein n=1 Tax=Devosia epidermidihirudinis TaxID=1293439 RepID=UPI00069772CD|nr:Gfo/Idh/MocA family oxidoreductase [Devosia epidermidihirudinis]
MLGWGIVGTSFISTTMADAIKGSPGSRIAAVTGRDAGRLAAFASQHDIATTYGSLDELLADPAVDVVYIGTPNHMHHEGVIAAAKAGKAILSEKSLTRTLAQAGALAEAVRDHDVLFVEGLMYLAHPMYRHLPEMLADVGTIASISGFYAADIWDVVNPQGGGTLYNIGCYPVSLLQFVMQTAFGDAAFADRVVTGSGVRSPKDGNIGHAAISVRFGNGVLATLQSSDMVGMAHDFVIVGDKGTLRFLTNPWLPGTSNRLQFQAYGETAEITLLEDSHDAFHHQVLLMERCVAQGLTQAARPSPRLKDSLEIMGLLAEWEAACG